MNAKADVQVTDKRDVIRWGVAGVVLLAGVGGFYYFSTASTLLRVVALLACVAVALAVIAKTAKGRMAWGFIQETNIEVRKVVWPSRQEAIQTTLAVIVMVVVIALMIWIVDSILFWLVQALTT